MSSTRDRISPGALGELFGNPKPIIAMLHLPPLPGSPFYGGQPFEEIVEWALRDAEVLKGEGVDGLMVENFGDRPFLKPDEIGHETTAFLSVVAREVIRSTGLPVGISCLANGAVQAIAAFRRIRGQVDQGQLLGQRLHRRRRADRGRCAEGPPIHEAARGEGAEGLRGCSGQAR